MAPGGNDQSADEKQSDRYLNNHPTTQQQQQVDISRANRPTPSIARVIMKYLPSSYCELSPIIANERPMERNVRSMLVDIKEEC